MSLGTSEDVGRDLGTFAEALGSSRRAPSDPCLSSRPVVPKVGSPKVSRRVRLEYNTCTCLTSTGIPIQCDPQSKLQKRKISSFHFFFFFNFLKILSPPPSMNMIDPSPQ